MDIDRRCLIFLHIPKTAGQTLNAILARQYDPASTAVIADPSETAIPFARVARQGTVALVRGHLPYGIHETLGVDAVYITLLRQPVARVVSIYEYIKRTPHHPLHQTVHERRLTLSEFVESDVNRREVVDGQTRQLAGIVDRDPDEQSLATAISNLQRITVAGLTERFDESVLLFRRCLRWRLPFYVSKNVAPPSPSVTPLPADLELVARYNRLDGKLYEAARRAFEQRVVSEGPTFRAELAAFRQLNRVTNRYLTLRHLWRCD